MERNLETAVCIEAGPGSMRLFPDVLSAAIADGSWRNPGSKLLQRIFGEEFSDLGLYESELMMSGVASQLDSAGYVDDPEFCLIRESADQAKNDPRLVFEQALFVGGSTVPGDDVFLIVDLEADDLKLYLFDWELVVPNRWSLRGTLPALLHELYHHPD